MAYRKPDLTEIKASLAALPGWALRDDKLEATYKLPSFRHAITFITQIAAEAEMLDHHPTITNTSDQVQLSLCTHAMNNSVTDKDFELAVRISKIAATFK